MHDYLSLEDGASNKLCFNLQIVMKSQVKSISMIEHLSPRVGWFKTPVSNQTEKIMADTKISDYIGLIHHRIIYDT